MKLYVKIICIILLVLAMTVIVRTYINEPDIEILNIKYQNLGYEVDSEFIDDMYYSMLIQTNMEVKESFDLPKTDSYGELFVVKYTFRITMPDKYVNNDLYEYTIDYDYSYDDKEGIIMGETYQYYEKRFLNKREYEENIEPITGMYYEEDTYNQSLGEYMLEELNDRYLDVSICLFGCTKGKTLKHIKKVINSFSVEYSLQVNKFDDNLKHEYNIDYSIIYDDKTKIKCNNTDIIEATDLIE